MTCFIDILPALLWGDPHFMSLDGRIITFNGLGKYLMMQGETANNVTFELQGNMERPLAADGTLAQATAFTAFAARYNDSSVIQISMSHDQKSK